MPTINLQKGDESVPWGFRLQGGKDFGAPLTVQRINPGSVAAHCGLQIGDIITTINRAPTAGLKHKDAQDLIMQGGISILLDVNRGTDSHSAPAPQLDRPTAQFTVAYDAPRYDPEGFNLTPSHGLSMAVKEPVRPGGSNVARDPAVKYTPSSTCQLVRDLDAGKEVSVSPLTGAAIRAAPAQSRLHNMLEKQCTLTDDNGSTPRPAPVASGSTALYKTAPTPFSSTPAPHSTPSYRPPAPAASPPAAAPVSKAVAPPSRPAGGGAAPGLLPGLAGLPGMPNAKIPVCNVCKTTVTGQYITALDRIWCQTHFVCSNPGCERSLVDCGFVEEEGQLFCQQDYEAYFAPRCDKCDAPISTDVVKAMGKSFHPHCFACAKCMQPIQGGVYHLNQGLPYCDKDWKVLFQTKCHSCQFAIEPGDQWIEALSQNWHSECFNCTACKVNLESGEFFNKGGRPYCKDHSN